MAWISSQGFRVNLAIKQSPIRCGVLAGNLSQSQQQVWNCLTIWEIVSTGHPVVTNLKKRLDFWKTILKVTVIDNNNEVPYDYPIPCSPVDQTAQNHPGNFAWRYFPPHSGRGVRHGPKKSS
jgi:hypothetical protein